MSAVVIILPGNPPDPLIDPDFHEQRIREEIALVANLQSRPPRCRPLLVIDNARRRD